MATYIISRRARTAALLHAISRGSSWARKNTNTILSDSHALLSIRGVAWGSEGEYCHGTVEKLIATCYEISTNRAQADSADWMQQFKK